MWSVILNISQGKLFIIFVKPYSISAKYTTTKEKKQITTQMNFWGDYHYSFQVTWYYKVVEYKPLLSIKIILSTDLSYEMKNQNFQMIDLIDLSPKHYQQRAIQQFQYSDVYTYKYIKDIAYLVKWNINQQYGTQW